MSVAPGPWDDVTAARLPGDGLAALGPVRDRPGVRVHPAGGSAWVRFPAGSADVVRCLLAVPGVAFFRLVGDRFHRFGSRLPSEDAPPPGDGLPLAAALAPAKLGPLPPPDALGAPVALGVVRGGEPRPASAVVCEVGSLAGWADAATTAELAAVTAARCGTRVVLTGANLPSVPGGVRLWGDTVLVPVGFRPDPDLPAAVLRDAAGVAADELLLILEDGADAVPRAAFAPLTRAGVRLARPSQPPR